MLNKKGLEKTHLIVLGFILIIFAQGFAQGLKPNIIIIQTDEHNFRTLGCYREQLSKEQAFIWGEGVKVDTPNLDRLAHEGAICNNFYASSPVCTPSRASLMSGLYPIATASYQNDIPMKDDIITFAEVLRKEGYATSYLGKWHLDGKAKPGFAPERKFGFEDNRYMFNRGHWKAIGEKNGKPYLLGNVDLEKETQRVNLNNVGAQNFTTDFLTNKALEILERDKRKPFCMMISIPDPHGPNQVRPPYDTMFKDMHFETPKTMKTPVDKMPKWAVSKREMVNEYNQTDMQRYFGMVKCIDDNIGRLLDFLDKNGLTDNTIVVFTSDHGDLMGEHHRHNKSVPYETSARIPFLLRYPNKVLQGKIIKKTYTTTDFAPTILALMDAPPINEVHGINAKDDFISNEKEVIDDRITYMTSSNQTWVAAMNYKYKLVVSVSDTPWLIDLEKDPDEETNYYNDPKYQSTAKELASALREKLKTYKDPIISSGRKLRWK